MTDDEAKVFKSLPDDKSRAEFLDEFWAIRDPNPETPENEAKTEFEKRARYAALWFGSSNPYKGRDPGGPIEYAGGWSDERGRVYVLLGKPDVIIFFDGQHETTSHDGSRSRLRADQWILEEWIYDRLDTYVVFSRDTGGGWLLDSFHSNFVDLLESAKLNWFTSETQGDARTWFRFSADFGPKGLQIMIPVDRVSTDDHFKVALGVQVNIYRDNIKIDEIRLTKELEETRENLFDAKNLRFGIPYAPSQKGNYLFDIIIQDRMAKSSSKYRVLLKQTF
jgi:GWxTD domain-containing protein